MDLVTTYIVSLTNLYGLVHMDKVAEIYNMQNDAQISVTDIETIARNNENELNKNFSEVYGSYFVHEAIMEFDEFDQSLAARKGKPFYIPAKTKLLKYVDDLYFEENHAYKALKKYVGKHFYKGDALKTKELCEDIHDECEMSHSISNLLEPFNRAGIIFDEQEQVQEVMSLVTDLSNHTRLWENNGFTPNELFQQEQQALTPLSKAGSSHAMTGGTTPSKKVGRNEPCPCGSGKKYKYCCGR